MYYFMKDKGFEHLNLEDVAECRIVYNHWRKTTKIGAGWKSFCETQAFEPSMLLVFEFPNPVVNYVLFCMLYILNNDNDDGIGLWC